MTRVAIVQMVPAFFRRQFFEQLGRESDISVHVLAGQSQAYSAVRTFDTLSNGALTLTENIRAPSLLPEMYWQSDCIDWLRQTAPQIVFLQPTPRLVSNYAVTRWTRKNNVPVVGWGMGQMPGLKGMRAQAQSALVRTLIRRLDMMVSYSTVAANYYASLGFPPDKIKIACNSIDTDACTEQYQRLRNVEWKADWLRKHDLQIERPTIVFVGRLVKSKQVDQLIWCVSQLQRDCQLLVVGDGPAREELELVAGALKLDVKFLGHLDGDEVAKAFMASDFFVLPALGGLAIQHAMAYGKPVIVSVGDGTEQDLVEVGKNGFIFERNNWQDLATKIDLMLNAKESWEHMGFHSRQIVETKVNLQNMVSVFVGVINSLVQT